MKMRLMSIAISLLAVAGCASNPAAEQARATKQMEHKILVYGPACEKLGFAKDTDKWRECIQREHEQSLMQMRNLNPPYPYWGPYYDRFYMRPWY